MLHVDASLQPELVEHFARIYQCGAPAKVDARAQGLVRDCTERWFARLPLPVTWHPNVEPYETFEEMVADIERGTFRVKNVGYNSPIFGECYHKFRAVHDWYGHYLTRHPFGIVGELGAFGFHAGQFPAECWPLIFNELVLGNSYADHRGERFPEDKLVHLPPGMAP